MIHRSQTVSTLPSTHNCNQCPSSVQLSSSRSSHLCCLIRRYVYRCICCSGGVCQPLQADASTAINHIFRVIKTSSTHSRLQLFSPLCFANWYNWWNHRTFMGQLVSEPKGGECCHTPKVFHRHPPRAAGLLKRKLGYNRHQRTSLVICCAFNHVRPSVAMCIHRTDRTFAIHFIN